MRRTSLAVAALLTSLSMATFMPAAYAEEGADLNSTPATTEQGCKKCDCTCDTTCESCAGSANAATDQKSSNPGECSDCNKNNSQN